MNLAIKKRLISICFIIANTVTYSQYKLPETPSCLDTNISQNISVDDLIFRSKQNIDQDPLTSFCFLLQAQKTTIIKKEKELIARNADTIAYKLFSIAKYKEAIYFQSLSGYLWFELDSIKQYSKSLRRLGENFHRLGDIYNSLKYLNIANELNEVNNFKQEKYHTYLALAWTYIHVRNFNESKKNILLSKLMIDKKIIKANNYDYYYLFSTMSRAQDNIPLAMQYNDSAIAVAKKEKDTRLLALAISNKANFLIYTKGNIDSIIEKITYALKINKQMNDKNQLNSNYGVLAKAYLYGKNYSKAIEAANIGLKYAIETGNKFEVVIKYRVLKNAYREKGDYEKALFYSEKYNLLYKEVYGVNDFNEIFEVEQRSRERLNKNIITNLKITSKQNKKIYWLISIISILIFGGIVNYYVHLKNIQKRKSEALKEKLSYDLLQMEMEALRSRMNPHFLFNSLNSIKSYIVKNDSRKASNYLTKFATLMRMILNHSKEKVISLEEELKAINYYLEIEQMRLKDKFEYHINIDNSLDTSEIVVPPSIIQPFAENSIWHGFSKVENKRLLQLNVLSKNNAVIIEIEDNGIGRKEARLLKLKNNAYRSVGTNIIKKTVEVFKNENLINLDIKTIDLYTSEKKSKGTKVIITIKEV